MIKVSFDYLVDKTCLRFADMIQLKQKRGYTVLDYRENAFLIRLILGNDKGRVWICQFNMQSRMEDNICIHRDDYDMLQNVFGDRWKGEELVYGS